MADYIELDAISKDNRPEFHRLSRAVINSKINRISQDHLHISKGGDFLKTTMGRLPFETLGPRQKKRRELEAIDVTLGSYRIL